MTANSPSVFNVKFVTRNLIPLMQFATGLGILARLDTSTDLYKKLNDTVVGGLYNTIPHPPASYLGPAHCFRQADGGGNNLYLPDLGRAGLPYARSVQGRGGLPEASLPDPGLIFDTILKRKDVSLLYAITLSLG
jgi:linoleate 10R-lipoxygenase